VDLLFKICGFLILIGFPFFGVGQVNLVPNPSFEDTLGCPAGYPDLDGVCKEWITFRGSPDYINNCSAVCNEDNQFGYQSPRSGSAYAGFNMYQTSLPDNSEHLGVQLSNPLIVGTKYYLTFFVSPAYKYDSPANLVCNKLGALLRVSPYLDPTATLPLPNFCHVYTDTIVKDTNVWFKISGSIVADQPYEYLILGNFFEDSFLDTLEYPNPFGPYNAYYYVDDVCLSSDSLECETVANLSYENPIQIKLYPIPVESTLTIEAMSQSGRIILLNCLGEVLVDTPFKDIQIIDLAPFKSGSYYLNIQTPNYIHRKTILKY
jgi:hypothetical protein